MAKCIAPHFHKMYTSLTSYEIFLLMTHLYVSTVIFSSANRSSTSCSLVMTRWSVHRDCLECHSLHRMQMACMHSRHQCVCALFSHHSHIGESGAPAAGGGFCRRRTKTSCQYFGCMHSSSFLHS